MKARAARGSESLLLVLNRRCNLWVLHLIGKLVDPRRWLLRGERREVLQDGSKSCNMISMPMSQDDIRDMTLARTGLLTLAGEDLREERDTLCLDGGGDRVAIALRICTRVSFRRSNDRERENGGRQKTYTANKSDKLFSASSSDSCIYRRPSRQAGD